MGNAGAAGPGLTAAFPTDPGLRRGDWERAASRRAGGRSAEEEEGGSRQVSARRGGGPAAPLALCSPRGAPPSPTSGLFLYGTGQVEFNYFNLIFPTSGLCCAIGGGAA